MLNQFLSGLAVTMSFQASIETLVMLSSCLNTRRPQGQQAQVSRSLSAGDIKNSKRLKGLTEQAQLSIN